MQKLFIKYQQIKYIKWVFFIGKFTWQNGDTFEGSHLNHESHGQGIYTFASNGEKFEGEYRDGKQTGRGTYLYQNADIFIGNYVQLN